MYSLKDHFTFQQSLFFPVLRMMNRGIRIDTSQKAALRDALIKAQFERQERLDYLAGHPLNPKSPAQLSKFFYNDLGIPGVKNLAGGSLTTNSPAMALIAERQPILKPLCQLIVELRSISVFLSTFIDARLDSDGRMRCSFNIAGTETYRFSSSENAFGSGMNLQNIPVKEKQKIKGGADYIALPNIRKLFIPDPGHTFFDIDLDRADLQVVIWEADDADMKKALRNGLDMHCVNACDVFAIKGIPYDELAEGHPNYPDHRGRIGEAARGKAKAGVHACVDESHEALTQRGWVKIPEILPTDCIVVCNKDGTNARLERPKSWWKGQTTTTMYEFSGPAYSAFVTHDHTVPYFNGNRAFVAKKASDVPFSARLPKAARLSGTRPVRDPRLLAAFHADGTITSANRVVWHFKKARKIQRLLKLCPEIQKSPQYIDGSYNLSLTGELAVWLIFEGKLPTWNFLNWTSEALAAYCSELEHWDGHRSATACFFTTGSRETAEIVQAMLHLNNQSGSILEGNRCWRVQINNRPLARLDKVIKHENWTGTVYCPETSSGFWLTRRHGRIAVTGNTNYGVGDRKLAQTLGITVAEAARFRARWFAAHPGIRKWHLRTEEAATKRGFIENRFGARIYTFGRINLPELLGWLPQSTVAGVINRGLCAIDAAQQRGETSAQLLVQVHDSLAGQFLTTHQAKEVEKIKTLAKVVIPYEEPLVIPVGMKLSEKSWGDAK